LFESLETHLGGGDLVGGYLLLLDALAQSFDLCGAVGTETDELFVRGVEHFVFLLLLYFYNNQKNLS
jgi:hypothetical protein